MLDALSSTLKDESWYDIADVLLEEDCPTNADQFREGVKKARAVLLNDEGAESWQEGRKELVW